MWIFIRKASPSIWQHNKIRFPPSQDNSHNAVTLALTSKEAVLYCCAAVPHTSWEAGNEKGGRAFNHTFEEYFTGQQWLTQPGAWPNCRLILLLLHKALHFSIPFSSMTISGCEIFHRSQGSFFLCADKLPSHWFDPVSEARVWLHAGPTLLANSDHSSAWALLILTSKRGIRRQPSKAFCCKLL